MYEKEHIWINKIMDVNFADKKILSEQLAVSFFLRDQGYDYISIKFVLEKEVELYPHRIRVPVLMKAIQKPATPVLFLLHVIDGIINELEIITADSTLINEDCISIDNVEYEVNREVMV